MRKFVGNDIGLKLETKSGTADVTFNAQDMIIAGYTGRDPAQVQKHIEELRRIGVEPPSKTPTYWTFPMGYVKTSEVVREWRSERINGEVEYVLLVDKPGKVYVAVGSDITDRELEKTDMMAAKRKRKPISPRVWDYDELKDHWDSLVLGSWRLEGNDHWIPYQQCTVDTIHRPEHLLKDSAAGDGSVLFCGTVPIIGEMAFPEQFRIQLYDPVLKRRLLHTYKLLPLFE